MRTYGETIGVTDEGSMGLCIPRKEQWVQQYADRMLESWTNWQTSLGVACSYIEQLKEDLAKLYDDPLKRMFIESTY